MKKIITIIILLSTLQCEAKSFSKKTSIISLATAVGINDKCKLSSHVPGYAIQDVKQGVPIYIKYEHGITDNIGIGIYFAHVNSKGTFPYAGIVPIAESNPKMSTNCFGLTGYYHFGELLHTAHLDPYAGLGFAIRNQPYTGLEGYQPPPTQIIPTLKIGVRYYVIPHFAIFGEIGADGLSTFTFGISLNTHHLS